MPENLRKQLASAVTSIQWSYAIFWSVSPTEPGVLEWGEGYYNGDIKTRKTIQAMEFNDDLIGLERSEQLRDLYKSLLAGESNPQTRRPSAALSPEDLTNTEWYYLVCMSFVFNLDQGLPGKALIDGRPIWLCNAHYADNKLFSRSLLAKSSSIQTVVCLPLLAGVMELGVTEMVSEDLSLIQHVKTFFSETPDPTVSTAVPSSMTYVNDDVLDNVFTPLLQLEELESPNSRPIQQGDNGFMVDGEGSRIQRWLFMDDDLSNCVQTPMASSECVSRSLQNCDHAVLQGDDLHYQNILSSLFKTSDQLIMGPSFQNRDKESSFARWRKDDSQASQRTKDHTPQRMLKKILFEVPRLHTRSSIELDERSPQEDELWRPRIDTHSLNHVVAERKRRIKVKERFSALQSLIPSTSKFDKLSVLDDTITYLKELENKVEELESCLEMSENQRVHKKPHDMAERTSDNYRNEKSTRSKRKVSEIDESSDASLLDSLYDSMLISLVKSEMLIEMRCPWRECLLLEIIDALSTLQLDSHSLQSSTVDGVASITVRSKLKGSRGVSIETIRQTLHRVIQK